MANKEVIPVKGKKKSNKKKALNYSPFEVENTFDRLFGNSWGWPNFSQMPQLHSANHEQSRLPKIDLFDSKNAMLVRAELPGLSKEDVEVTLDGDVLKIKGHVTSEKLDEGEEYYKQEIHNASFSRSISVSNNIDGASIEASLKDGVLSVTLPKAKESKKRTVNVQ